MYRGRRSLRVRVVLLHIRIVGHYTVLIVMRSLIALGIGSHVVIVVHWARMLLVVILVLKLMMGWILRLRRSSLATTSWSCARSHIDLSSHDTSAYASSRLPSRQMITIHLAGLGFMKQWLSTASATFVANT